MDKLAIGSLAGLAGIALGAGGFAVISSKEIASRGELTEHTTVALPTPNRDRPTNGSPELQNKSDQPIPSSARFEKGDAVVGVNVTLSPNKCTASILFDNAEVRGPHREQPNYTTEIPLRMLGDAATMKVSVRGFFEGPATLSASVITDVDQRLWAFVGTKPQDGVIDSLLDVRTISQFSGLTLAVELASGVQKGEQTLVAFDSIDLVMSECANE